MNGTWPDEQRIPIVLGTLVGARHPRLRDVFMPALLEYEIEGLFAPSLAGKRVKEVVDYVALHYLLSPESIWGYTEPGSAPIPYGHNRALDDLHSRWVGNGTIKGIWHTEEGGNAIANVEQLGSSAVRIFGRLTNWALTRGKSPTQTRIVGYYAGGAEHLPDPRWQTSWRFALEVIDQFIGSSPRLFNRSANTLAYADDRLESYGFESGDRMRRILIATPQSATWQGSTNIGWMGSKFDGWTSTSIQVAATGHLFKSDAEGYRTVALTATRNGPRGWFDIYLPESIALNANDDRQALLITLERT